MELRHLRYFVAAAETENVSRAAVKLHVSQPALSRQIRDLEEELGFSLLSRGAKSVRLTEAGRVFLSESKAVLQRVEDAIQAAHAAATGRHAELHVGYAPTLTARILPPAMRAFQAGRSEVRVRLHDLATEEMLQGLRDGKLHLAVSVRPAGNALRGFRFEELGHEPLRLAVAHSHPFARRRTVTVTEAARESLIVYSQKDYPDYHDLLATIFASVRGRKRASEEHDGVSSLISAVESGAGVAVVPSSLQCLVGTRLKLLSLTPDPKPLTIGVILPANGIHPAALEFLDHIQSASHADASRRVSSRSTAMALVPDPPLKGATAPRRR